MAGCGMNILSFLSRSDMPPGARRLLLIPAAIFYLVSNSVAAPDTVSNLTALTGASEREIILKWTAPGADGSTGTVSNYIIKYVAGSVLIASNFDAAYVSRYLHSFSDFKAPGEEEVRVLTGTTHNTTYYFAIKAVNSSGELGLWNYNVLQGINALNKNFSLIYPPGPVTDLTAAAQSKKVFLQWTCPGDDGYVDASDTGKFRLKYSTNPIETEMDFTNAGSEILISTRITPGEKRSYTVLNLVNDTRYYFAIKTIDENISQENWSSLDTTTPRCSASPINTAPDFFSLISPVNVVITTRPVFFDWYDSFDIDGDTITYDLRFSEYRLPFSPPQNTLVHMINPLIYSSYTYTGNLNDDTTYYWQVRAYDWLDEDTPSSARSFNTNINNIAPSIFSLTSPESPSRIQAQPVEFSWTKAMDPDIKDRVSYTLKISSTEDFTAGYSTSGLTSELFSLTTDHFRLTENIIYYWQVTARDLLNAVSVSSAYLFGYDVLDEPLLPFSLVYPPDNGVLTGERTFRFTESGHQDVFRYIEKYDLELIWYGGWPPKPVAETTTTYITYAGSLVENQQYYWRIRAYSNSGGNLVSTNTFSFRFNSANEAPYAFTPVTPDKYSFNSSTLTLQWNPAIDPDPGDMLSYSVIISSNQLFSGSKSYGPTLSAEIYIDDNLRDNTSYHWKVVASDIGGLKTTSEVRVFGVDRFPEPPNSFLMIYPADNTQLATFLSSFSWQSKGDPDPFDEVTYNLYISTGRDFTVPDTVTGLIGNTTDSSFRFLELREYFVRAGAVDKGFLERFSDIIRIFTGGKKLKPPANLRTDELSDGSGGTRLLWSLVTENEDGSIADDVAGYRIWRAKTEEELLASSFSTFVDGKAVTYIDRAAAWDPYYYRLKSYDTSGIESDFTHIICSEKEKGAVVFSDNGKIRCSFSDVITQFLLKDGNDLDDSLQLLITETPDGFKLGLRKYSDYSVIYEYTLPEKLVLDYEIPAGDSSIMQMSWFDGIRNIKIGGKYNEATGKIRLSTKKAGIYRAAQFALSSALSISGIVPPRVFTPNGDGKYDTIEFFLSNPQGLSISGEVFDLAGRKISALKPGSVDNSFVWEGLDENKKPVMTGIHIYVFKAGGEILSGTVIVAK